jgi:hypothetical protein
MGGDIGLGGGIVRNSLYSFVVIFLKVDKIKIVKKKRTYLLTILIIL